MYFNISKTGCYRLQVGCEWEDGSRFGGPLEETSLYRHYARACLRAAYVTARHVTVSGCRWSFCPVMLWSVCVYAGLITALWFAYSQGFFDTVDSQSFDKAILRYQDLAYHLIDLMVPINNWREARMVAAYMASWSAFQVITD